MICQIFNLLASPTFDVPVWLFYLKKNVSCMTIHISSTMLNYISSDRKMLSKPPTQRQCTAKNTCGTSACRHIKWRLEKKQIVMVMLTGEMPVLNPVWRMSCCPLWPPEEQAERRESG